MAFINGLSTPYEGWNVEINTHMTKESLPFPNPNIAMQLMLFESSSISNQLARWIEIRRKKGKQGKSSSLQDPQLGNLGEYFPSTNMSKKSSHNITFTKKACNKIVRIIQSIKY
jgi:hypothetical protein